MAEIEMEKEKGNENNETPGPAVFRSAANLCVSRSKITRITLQNMLLEPQKLCSEYAVGSHFSYLGLEGKQYHHNQPTNHGYLESRLCGPLSLRRG